MRKWSHAGGPSTILRYPEQFQIVYTRILAIGIRGCTMEQVAERCEVRSMYEKLLWVGNTRYGGRDARHVAYYTVPELV